MNETNSRRDFLMAAAGAAAWRPTGYRDATRRAGDIRIDGVEMSFADLRYRSPYKFGGVPVDRATILDVRVTVSSRRGTRATGTGSMPLGNVWAFPSRTLPYQSTLEAMKALAGRIASITRDYREFGHPIEINHHLEPAWLAAAAELSERLALPSPIPKLATLVTASAFDAAIHDAFGRLHRRSCYLTYGPEMMNGDLERYLGAEFRGESLAAGLRRSPVRELALFHSIGGSDAVTPAELRERIGDGMPETLAEWIRYNGLTHLKIKLQGEDLAWDVERVVAIDRVAAETRPEVDWKYCVDFNERCPNVDYVLEFLRRVRERAPSGLSRILYLEQPTARDLAANPRNVMHAAARLRPVVIDESLVDIESLRLAREMGYTGVALKACKGQSQAMLMAAAARKYGMFLTVQDLTCPGASLIHSVGIAAHVPDVAGIEANARQYMPSANRPWEKSHPGIFRVTDGRMRTDQLCGPGLGTTAAPCRSADGKVI